MPKTLTQLLDRASNAILRKEEVVYDVAGETGQIVGNVAHMRWFRLAVAEELISRHSCWAHLGDALENYRKQK